MLIILRVTRLATLLISLHLLFLTVFYPQLEVYFPHKFSSKPMFIASNGKVLQGIDNMDGTSQDFQPKDNGGPDYTRGSGTR